MNIIDDDNSKLLMKIATDNNMNMDKLFSAYLIIGNDLFFLLDLLEGMQIHIPTHNKRTSAERRDLFLIEYKDEFVDCKSGDIITYNGVKYRVYTKGRKVLNHNYLPVTKVEEDD